MFRPTLLATLLVFALSSCRVPSPPPLLPIPPRPVAPVMPPKPRPGDAVARAGDEILVGGEMFHTGTCVVLWIDPGGYDAYRMEPRFSTPNAETKDRPAKPSFGQRPLDFLAPETRKKTQERGWDLYALRCTINQLVIHYDAVGNSRDCFRVLHDLRGLSSHFLLDLDGTIYQTLDLKEMAWHAGRANGRSIGIEIANVGAYDSLAELEALRDRVPAAVLAQGPARGQVRDREVWQYPFTEAQYEALIRLGAALQRVFPEIRLGTPESLEGAPAQLVLSDEQLASYRGFLGHHHVHEEKIDPGPAFDWNRFLRGVEKALLVP